MGVPICKADSSCGCAPGTNADVCRGLEIEQPTRAAERLDDDEKGVDIVDTLGGPQEMLIISEPGLYKLIQTSRKPAAKGYMQYRYPLRRAGNADHFRAGPLIGVWDDQNDAPSSHRSLCVLYQCVEDITILNFNPVSLGQVSFVFIGCAEYFAFVYPLIL